jgi:hypothetical protein
MWLYLSLHFDTKILNRSFSYFFMLHYTRLQSLALQHKSITRWRVMGSLDLNLVMKELTTEEHTCILLD